MEIILSMILVNFLYLAHWAEQEVCSKVLKQRYYFIDGGDLNDTIGVKELCFNINVCNLI